MMGGLASARELVLELLRQINPEAVLAEFEVSPPDHYTFRVDLPDELGKTLILYRRGVDRALRSPTTRRSLELVLRSAVLLQEAHRSIDRAIQAGARSWAMKKTVPNRPCDMCRGPIRSDDHITVHRGRLVHQHCKTGASGPPPA
jgi:hypothetical protein